MGAQEPGSLSTSELSEVETYLAQACASTLHPLHWLVSNLVDAYNVSYGGVRSHPTLLPHAMEELESITSRLYKVIRVLFPGLPPADMLTRLQSGLSEEVCVFVLLNFTTSKLMCSPGTDCNSLLSSPSSSSPLPSSDRLHHVCPGCYIGTCFPCENYFDITARGEARRNLLGANPTLEQTPRRHASYLS